MKRNSPVKQRLAAVGLLGLALLGFPLVSLPQGWLGGVPASVAYLFGAWCLLILLAWRIAERGGK